MKQSPITFAWEVVDSDRALEYLETMGESNRRVRQSHIDYLASQMRAGLWRKTHQTIAFDSNERLVDGQHRLWALIEAKVELELLIARGIAPEDVAAIDSGLARTFEDVAHYEGWNIDQLASAVAKMLVLGPSNAHKKVPPDVAHAWYEHYQASVDFALKLRLEHRPTTGKSMTTSMASAFARAHASGVAGEVLLHMGEILKSGQIQFEADRAAFVLRDAWLQGRLGRTKGDQYYKTEGAIRAFVERRPTKSLQRPEAEVFKLKPLPPSLRFDMVNSANSPRTSKVARARKLAKATA